MVPTGAYWCLLVSYWFKLVHIGVLLVPYWRLLLPYWCKLLHTGVLLVRAGAYWCPAPPYWCLLAYTGSNWCLLVSYSCTGANWRILVSRRCRTGAYWHPTGGILAHAGAILVSYWVHTGVLQLPTGVYWCKLAHTGVPLLPTGVCWCHARANWCILAHTGVLPAPYRCPLVCTGAYWCLLVQTGVRTGALLSPTGAYWCHSGTNRGELGHTGVLPVSYWCKLVRTGAYWCELAHASVLLVSYRCKLVSYQHPTGVYWRILASTGTYWCIPVHTGAYWRPTVAHGCTLVPCRRILAHTGANRRIPVSYWRPAIVLLVQTGVYWRVPAPAAVLPSHRQAATPPPPPRPFQPPISVVPASEPNAELPPR